MTRTHLSISRLTMLLLAAIACGTALADDLAGSWTLTIDTPRGVQHPTMDIEQTGDGYKGVYHSLRGPIDIESVARDGANFSFPLKITVPIGEVEVNYTGTIDGENITGTVESPRGQVPFTAERD